MDALTIYLLTFNCALSPVDILHFSRHFFDALPHTDNSTSSTPPDLIVLSLQEIAPIAYSFLGGSFLTPYLVSLGQAVDRAVAEQQWDCHYDNIVADSIGMTGLMVFVRSDLGDRFSNVDIARVGFGIQEMGNKGAIGARLSFSPATGSQSPIDLTFVATHLAPNEKGVSQRNADWRSIVERLVFNGFEADNGERVEVGDESESAALLASAESANRGIFTPTSYLFLAGDLNYRTSDTPPQGDDHLRFPQANADPGSSHHYSHLFEKDQLRREMEQSQCFQGLTEAPITFPPTYKYSQEARDAACESKDDEHRDFGWTRTRWPSWCDRVLYLESPSAFGDQAKVNVLNYDALPVLPTSDHRPVALAASIPVSPTRPSPEARAIAPFPIDRTWENRRDLARRKEFLVGCLAYMGWTWEGNSLVVASVVGVAGIWFVIRSLVEA